MSRPPSLAWRDEFLNAGPPPGTEIGPDGWPIGRDPRRMTQDEMSALAALRAHCLDCCGGSPDEVHKCIATRCPSCPFRTGSHPWRAPPSEEKLAAARERGKNSPMPSKVGPPEPKRPVRYIPPTTGPLPAISVLRETVAS